MKSSSRGTGTWGRDGWKTSQEAGQCPGMCCWGPGWRGQWTWRGQVDKKTLRRKTSTSLATAICRRPQHEKGPPPLPPAQCKEGPDSPAEGKAGDKRHQDDFQILPECSVLCSASPLEQAGRYQSSGQVQGTEDTVRCLHRTRGKATRAGLPG